MTSQPSHQLLRNLLENPGQEHAPFTSDKTNTRIFGALPTPNDITWKVQFDVNPTYCSQLWLAETAVDIREYYSQDAVTATLELLTKNIEWVPRLAPYFTKDYLMWLAQAVPGNHITPLLTSNNGLSGIAREVWLGDINNRHVQLGRLDTFSTVDVYESSVVGHGILLKLMEYAADPDKVSEKEHRHWAHLNLLWGIRGFNPVANTNSLGRAWGEIGADFDVADPEPSHYPKTRTRLNLVRQESSDIRLFNFAALLPMVSTKDDVHPSPTSELCIWARLDGIRGQASLFDAARAFIPEYRQEFNHLEALGMPIKEACKLLIGHEKDARIAPVALPEDVLSIN